MTAAPAPKPSAPRALWLGARPRTLGASIVPVVVGTTAAGLVSWSRLALALTVGLGLQVGVNYANDYFDGVKGVDTAERLGPPRLVASGMASSRTVALAAAISFALAGIAGLALAAITSWWLVAVGAACLAGALLYSGGPRPYANLGLGEVFVFLFFGLVATAGSAYVQTGRVPASAWWSGAAVGFLAVAILMANNARDIASDSAAGKRTLAVRLGEHRARLTFFLLIIIGPPACVILGVALHALPWQAFITLIALGQLRVLTYRAWPPSARPDFRRLLLSTALLHAAFGLLLAIGLWIG